MQPSRQYTDTEKPYSSVVMVTPEMAELWLKKNLINRRIRRGLVDQYARDMMSDGWQLSGESIKFASDGSLLDGQHRLAAVVRSNVTVPMFVTRALSADARVVIDTGARRSAADMLTLAGKHNAALLAATVRLAINAEIDTTYTARVSHSEITQFVESNPDIAAPVKRAASLARHTDCRPAVAAYTLWRLSKIDADEASQFWTDATEKVGLQLGDPVLAMSKRFTEARRQRVLLSYPMQLSLIFRAWNLRREGKSAGRLRITPGEKLPVPK